MSLPLLVLIGGSHASGKSTAANLLQNQLNSRFPHLKMANWDMMTYFTPTKELDSRKPTEFNFEKLENDIKNTTDVDLIIIYGLYALLNSNIRDLATLNVFIDCDADVRLGRWIKRDILNSGNEQQQLEILLNKYLNHSRQEAISFIDNTKIFADIVLPHGADGVNVTLIVDGLQPLIIQRLESENRSGSLSNVQEREMARQGVKASEPSLLSLSSDIANNKRFYGLD